MPRPVVPKDWSIAKRLPEATMPALPIDDCQAAAVEPAAIPPTPKPTKGRTIAPNTLPPIFEWKI